MKKSRRANRPLLRSRRSTSASPLNSGVGGRDERSLTGSLGDSHPGAARLASLAGSAGRPDIDQLESRQLLFSLTISPSDVDPATGLGQVRAVFAYHIPIYQTSAQLGTNTTTTTDEDFNDEFPPPGGGALPNVQNFPSGRVLLGSFIRINHNIIPTSNFQVRAVLDGAGLPTGERFLLARPDLGQFFSFLPQTQNGLRQAVNNVSFSIGASAGSNAGLDAAKFTVQLFYDGQLTQSFTGAALLARSSTNSGVGRFTFNAASATPAFDQIRILATTAGADAFTLDDLSITSPPGNFVDILSTSEFTAEFVLAGKVGTSVQFLDVYGKEIRNTIRAGVPTGGTLRNDDLNDDGITDFNDGIGKIILVNADETTALTAFGGKSRAIQVPDPDDDFIEGGFAYKRIANLGGIYDDMESAGLLFDVNDTNPTGLIFHGLPSGAGSVVIGSPYVRDLNNYNAAGVPFDAVTGQVVKIPITSGFVNPNQGIFVQGNRNVGSIYIHGMLFGSSNFTGSVERIVVSDLYGSITVAGDLGALIVSGDAGTWQRDLGQPEILGLNNLSIHQIAPAASSSVQVKTTGQLVVGRTVGEISIGGRSLLDVTVVGNTSDPLGHPPRATSTYFEKEFGYAVDPATGKIENDLERTLFNSDYATDFALRAGRQNDQALLFGGGFYRNDSLMSAEWVNTLGTGVRIFGDLSTRDHINTADDQADVYAFASDGSTPISLEIQGGIFFRLLDEHGRTVASPNITRGSSTTQFVRYQPTTPGVYYVVVTDPNADDTGAGVGAVYSLTILGMAAVTLGEYRTGANSGSGDATRAGPVLNNTINVLSGNVGTIRIGTARYGNVANADVSVSDVTNTPATDDDALQDWLGGTFNIPGNLYNITTGSDIAGSSNTNFFGAIDITVGGDFGSLITGQSRLVGIGPAEGDVNGFSLRVNGRIALIDVRGGSGINQDNDTDPLAVTATPGTVRYASGRGGGNGDIGMIRYGSHIANDVVQILTSPNSTVGGILVSQDIDLSDMDRQGLYFGNEGLLTSLGAGSDVRFVDFPRIDTRATVDQATNLFVGQVQTFVDDGGGQVRVRVVGPGNLNGLFAGLVRVLPINGSQGVSIAQISVDLTGGLSLEIESVGAPGSTDVISIGRIIVTAADAPTISGITIKGNVQTDVWRIDSAAALAFVRNDSPLGDIVALDMAGLTTLNIATGDLGRTQVPAWGPQLIGPFMGINNNNGLTREAPIFLPQLVNNVRAMDPNWGGRVYRPSDTANVDGGQAFLDDVGSPFDPYLNGMIVRTGVLDTVSVGGAVGDVIASTGNIIRVLANADRVTPKGRFDGIVGTIYSGNTISLVDVGDGVAQRDPGPLSTTGIFALNDIVQVLNGNSKVASISSTIDAVNSIPFDLGGVQNGVGTITLTGGGSITDAYIGAQNLDSFWTSFNYPDGAINLGIINLITVTDGNIFRSEIGANGINTITIAKGFYDASFTNSTGDIGTVTAGGYRNSTLKGTDLEFRPNAFQAANDLTLLTTTGKAGDIDDLIIDIGGSVTQEISARSFNRAQIDVDNTLKLLTAAVDFRASKVTAGTIPIFKAGRNIQSSKITVSGALPDVSATDSIINSDIAVVGPDGRIDKVTATNLISGSITASGPIGTVESTKGDIRARVTTTGIRGNITTLKAFRDLAVTTDISGTVDDLIAGRHIGDKSSAGAVVIRGNLKNAAAGGQLYSDLRVGQSITGKVTTSIVQTLPSNNQVGTGSIIAFGSIAAVNIVGDFAGDIISYSGGIGAVTIFGGSFHPNRKIAAYDGSINEVTITAGNLYGDIHADYILYAVNVIADAYGVFGDIGVNPKYNTQQSYDFFRNRIPVGIAGATAVQGPRITAGQNIGSVLVTNGSIFEASIIAGHAIGSIDVRRGKDFDLSTGAVTTADNGNITTDGFTYTIGNTIAAGDTISSVKVQGDVVLTFILAGIVDLGDDLTPGGVGVNKDTVKSGRISTINVASNAYALVMSAGMEAGPDGLYNTGDDLVALGVSNIEFVTISGQLSYVSAFSDILSQSLLADSRIFKFGPSLEIVDPQIDPVLTTPGTLVGASGLSFTRGSESATVFFSGAGQAFYDAARNRVVVVNSNFTSNLTVSVTSGSGALTDFDIVSNDDATINNIVVSGDLRGDSDIVFDAYVVSINVGNFSGTGSIHVGEDAGTITTKDFLGGEINVKYLNRLQINGNYGALVAGTRDEVFVHLLASGGIAVTGADRGAINVDRDLPSFFVGGVVDSATLRSGSSIGAIDLGPTSRTWISARDGIGSVKVRGSVFDSSILAGADLGTDTEFGGFGLAADTATTGFIGDVTITGDFAESDLVAGILRGEDGFFGSSDDQIAEGRSAIGKVTITGTQVGSSRNSESYRIASTGTLGTVTIGGVPGTKSGNFEPGAVVLPPLSFAVSKLAVNQDARVYTAQITFNQPVDSSSLAGSLGVYEVRGVGQTEIRLVSGIDYTLTYDAATNSALVRFSPDVTNRGLPVQTGVPGPGVYRFRVDQALVRAQLVNARLDGNADGKVTLNDNYSQDDFVGDAGDKFVDQTTLVKDSDNNTVLTVDFRAASDLNIVLDDNRTPDGLPDVNRVFSLRGAIGDHPDNDTNFFRFAGDTDLFKVTLQAGQILRLGQVGGPAKEIPVNLVASDGTFASSSVVVLPVNQSNVSTDTTNTPEKNFLIKTTGTYYILVGSTTAYTDPNVVPNPDARPNRVGNYEFTVQIFDDGDSGFSATTDAGNGTSVVNAPAPISFAGVDGVFGTGDDLGSVSIGGYVFTYSRGADGVANTADDLVSGADSSGSIVSSRTGAGVQTTVVNSAIGPAGHAGVPVDVFADVDIYHLNNRLPIQTGSKIKITVKLNALGADLGSRNQSDLINTFRTLTGTADFRGNVQFGVFDTTDSTGTDDARLLFSPTDFSSNGGKPGTLVAGENASYGFDANGDFFIEFIAPGRQGNPSQPATYAVYLQGAFNTDYQLEVVSNAADGGVNSITKRKQNIFLETRGGSIKWLEAGGLTSTFRPFQAAVLGFTGTQSNGQTVQDYVISNVRSTLQQVFDAAGLEVNFSTNPLDFEFQDFSTVYITSSADPVSLVFDNLNSAFFGFATGSVQPYGFSQHSDPLNADKKDEAVVFAPSFAALNYAPSQADLNLFVQSLSAAIGRRAGELLGLRVTSDNVTTGLSPRFDLMAANSVRNPPGVGRNYELSNQNRFLSTVSDSINRSDFFLGQQNAKSLLDQVLSAR